MLAKSLRARSYLYLRWIPMRVIICVMMFSACWTSYMCRLQMPILAVPMIAGIKDGHAGGACATSAEIASAERAGKVAAVDEPAWRGPDELLHEIAQVDLAPRQRLRRSDDQLIAVRSAKEEPPQARGAGELWSNVPFAWTPQIRGQLLSGYGYGNVPGNMLGGMMAIKYGPRRTILWTSVISASVSLVSPLLANLHWGVLLLSRVIIGLTGGVVFPACHTMVAKWAPPDEKSRFVWSLLGGTFGTIFTYPMIASIAEHVNWEAAWYIPSLLMFIWIFFWFIFAYDSPMDHPGITDEEKNYIITAQHGTVRSERGALGETPFLEIFTSVPFIALVVCHFGNLFLLFFYQNSMMLYLTKALGFKLDKGGALAGLPWLARMGFGFFFSWAGDIVKKREFVSLTVFRKSATFFSHFLPGVCLVIVGYVGCSELLANVFLFLALGFNGAASIANLSNNQDLSPNYAGLLYGIMNTIGTTAGIIIPPLVEAIAGKYGHPIDRWQLIFWIGAGVCIASMVIFIAAGSAKIQSWNEPKNRANI